MTKPVFASLFLRSSKLTNRYRRFFILFIGLFWLPIVAVALPILTDVQLETPADSLRISFVIVNFVDTCTVQINAFDKIKLQPLFIDDSLWNWQQESADSNYIFQASLSRSHLPKDFSLEQYGFVPKLIFNNRIYYEMKKFDNVVYSLEIHENKEEIVHCAPFWISKYEVTNEQFLHFVQNDGYDAETFWTVPPHIMAKKNVGWFFQGKLEIRLPGDWDLALKPPYTKAFSAFIYGPVTNVTWFEANAFCQWMGGRMPYWLEMKAAWPISRSDSTSGKNAFSAPETNKINNLRSGVAEWMYSGFEPNQSLCRGCNEMFILANSISSPDMYPARLEKCPLYKNQTIGFRFAIPIPVNQPESER